MAKKDGIFERFIVGARNKFGGRNSATEDQSQILEDEANSFGMSADEFERQLREQVGEPTKEPFDIAKHIVETEDMSYLRHLEEVKEMTEFMLKLSVDEREKANYITTIEKLDKEIKSIREQINILTAERDTLKNIEDLQNQINTILDEQKANFERSILAFGKFDINDITEITDVTSLITNNISSLHQHMGATNTPLDILLTQLNMQIARYYQATGHNCSININFYTDELVKKYANIYVYAIKKAEDIIKNDPANANINEYQAIIENAYALIEMLKITRNNPDRVNEIISEIEGILKNATPTQSQQQAEEPTPTRNNVEGFANGLRIFLSNAYKELASATIDSIKKFTPLSSSAIIAAKNSDILAARNDQNILTDAEKQSICEEVKKEFYDDELERVFGKKGAEFVLDGEYSKLLEQIAQISAFNNVAGDYENLYNEFKTTLDTLQRNGVLMGVTVDYDENNSKISITFREGTMGTIEHSVVPIKIKEQQDLMANLLSIKPTFKNHFTDCIKGLKLTPGFITIAEQIKGLTSVDKYPHLSAEEIGKILDQSGIYQEVYETYGKDYAEKLAAQNGTAYDQAIANAYGKEFTDFIFKVMLYFKKVNLNSLDGIQHGTSEFISAYSSLYDSINEFINAVKAIPDYDKYISEISFDENEQKLKIAYTNNASENFEIQIMPENILNRNRQTTQNTGGSSSQTDQDDQAKDQTQTRNTTGGGAPQQPHDQTQQPPQEQARTGVDLSGISVPTDKQAAIDKYLDQVNLYNERVAELSILNQSISIAEIPLDLEDAKLVQISADEARAKEEENKLRDIRQNLAKYRFEYKNVHNEFITQNPEVVAAKLNEPLFGAPMAEFIKNQDDMSLEAERIIIELSAKREQDPTAAAEITNKIKLLAAYMDSRNSIIARCIVSESKTNNIDIVSFLAERRAAKRKSRELITKAVMGENVSQIIKNQDVQTQTPAPDQTQLHNQADQTQNVQQTQQPSGDKVVRFELKLKATPKITRKLSTIEEGIKPLDCQIMKNKLKIKFSAGLKDKLKELSAKVNMLDPKYKVSLVDKNNRLKRTSTEFNPDVDEYEMGFKDGRELTPEDYMIEIRSVDGKKSELIYTSELEDEHTHTL